jgi:tetratricopeptide (TPR) repeat protein
VPSMCNNKRCLLIPLKRDNQPMKFGSTFAARYLPYIFWGIILASASGFAQNPSESRPINLDRDLRDTNAKPNLAASYYHYALAKWHENDGDMRKALPEMQLALQFNPMSSAIHVEIAILMGRTGNIPEAMRYAQEAARLDPQDPESHWLLANIYFGTQDRRSSSKESIQKAINELNVLKELTPNDERIFFNLGGAYFELKEPEKAIEAFEKFQSLSKSDAGYREIAKYYEQLGNLEKAIEYLNKGLEIQPDSIESLVSLGDIYSRLNKNKDAISVYKNLLSTSDNSAPILKRLATALFETGAYKETIDVLKELETKSRPDRASQLLLGRTYLELRRYSDAIKTLQMVLERIPDDVETRFYLARAFEESGKNSDAAAIYSALLKEMTDTSQETVANRMIFQQRLAAVYLELGEYEKAIDLYDEMAKTDPKVNSQLINAYRISGRFDKALLLGKPLFEKNSTDVQLGVIYARTLADAGQIKSGADILMDLLKLHPENVDLYVNLSEIYRQDQQYKDAEEILLRGENRKLHPAANERLKLQRASVYERQKEFDRAELLFKEMLKVNPQNATVLNYMGYMLADRGIRLEEAVRYVKEALEIDPGNGAYLDSLGWALFKLNDLENAEKYLLEANSLVVNDATIDDHLGDLYFKAGKLEKAQDFWQKSALIGKEPEEVKKVRQKLEMLQETLRKRKAE